ncbi:MAG: DUF2726 domain-containing protein [Clostridia bacterium]|nr:DUF2726 domain-containing protein [Clostridia bacterium]
MKNMFYLICAQNNEIFKILVASFVIIFILFILFVLFKKRKPKVDYLLKSSLLTATEIQYFNVLQSIIGNDLLILPQINLASIIDKKGANNFRTELFRNVDFGLFDYNYRPILLIEINDNSHFRKDRKERDKRVNEICKSAGIPLVTFWVKDGINLKKMSQQINNCLKYDRF